MPWVAGLNLPRVPEEAADGTEMREHWFCPKGYVHQLVHQPIRTMANNRNDSEERICLFAVKSEQPQTAANLLSLPYKEGVAGSTPASPTYKSPTNSGASPTARWRSIGRSGPIWASRPRNRPDSRQTDPPPIIRERANREDFRI